MKLLETIAWKAKLLYTCLKYDFKSFLLNARLKAGRRKQKRLQDKLEAVRAEHA